VSRRSRPLFLFLVIAQMAHSVEEYATRLYEVFAPARLVSGLASDDLATGLFLAVIAKGYFSGAMTAVVLVCVAAGLALSLRADARDVPLAPSRVAWQAVAADRGR
jgi:hypothetical protein